MCGAPLRGQDSRSRKLKLTRAGLIALKSLDSSPPAVQYLGAGRIDDRTPIC
jgi:hypothetical protein